MVATKQAGSDTPDKLSSNDKEMASMPSIAPTTPGKGYTFISITVQDIQ